MKIAKVHSSEDYYYNRFDEASTSLLDMEYRMQRNWSLPQLIQRIAGLLVLVGVVWFGLQVRYGANGFVRYTYTALFTHLPADDSPEYGYQHDRLECSRR